MNKENHLSNLNQDDIIFSDLYSLINSNIDKLTDLKNQYMDLLSELSICEELDNDIFYKKICDINSIGKIFIAYKKTINFVEILGSGTIIIEPKIIRGGKNVGHVEDIVVKKSYRGNKIAQSILNKLKEFAKTSNCYKIILDCDEKVCPVYKLSGFDIKGIQMGLYF